MTLLGLSAFDIGSGTFQPIPYLKVGGATATYVTGLRNTFTAMSLEGFSHYEVPVNVIPAPAANQDLFWNQDFAPTRAGADNSEWCLWILGKVASGLVDYAIGLVYTGSVAKLQVWEVTHGSPPTFTKIGSAGGTTISVAVRRIAFEVDLDGANYPLKVHLDTGSGFPGTPEISTSSANVQQPTTKSTHYQYEVTTGDKEGDIELTYDNESWTDDLAGSQVLGKQNRLETCMAHEASSGLTSPSGWASGDANNKKYWMTADHNRNTGTPSDPAAADDHMIGQNGDEDGFAIYDHNAATAIKGIALAAICSAFPFIHTKLCTTESATGYGTTYATATNTLNNNFMDAYPSTPKGDDWTNAIFNTLQVQVKAKENNLKIERLAVVAFGTGLAKPTAVNDDVADVASICPAVAAGQRRRGVVV